MNRLRQIITITHVIARKLPSSSQQEKLTWQSTSVKEGKQRDATRQASASRVADCHVGHDNGLRKASSQ